VRLAALNSLFFSLPTWAVALILLAVIGAATAAGYAFGYTCANATTECGAVRRAPGALLGVVGLIPGFGLSLAVGRYEDRRAATVTGRTQSGRRTSVPS
jgi:hypothetical protein